VGYSLAAAPARPGTQATESGISRNTPRPDLRSEDTQRHALQEQGPVAIGKVQISRRSEYRSEDQTGQAAVIKKRFQAQTDFMRGPKRDFPATPIIHADAGCLMTAIGHNLPFPDDW
jgi:hypothetical protein